jgi:hypothetical protein
VSPTRPNFYSSFRRSKSPPPDFPDESQATAPTVPILGLDLGFEICSDFDFDFDFDSSISSGSSPCDRAEFFALTRFEQLLVTKVVKKVFVSAIQFHLPAQIVRAVARQQNVFGSLHHQPRQPNRIFTFLTKATAPAS